MTFRRTPYKDVTRAKCHRCGAAATESFNARACAGLANCYVALCGECDIASNRMILDFLRFPGRRRLLKEYAALKAQEANSGE